MLEFNKKYKLSQAWKTHPNWIDKQVSRGRLPQVFANIINKLSPSMDAIYPGRWDIQFDLEMYDETIINRYTPTEVDDYSYQIYLQTYGGEEGLINWLYEPFEYRRQQLRQRSYMSSLYYDICENEFHYAKGFKFRRMFFVIHFPEVTIKNSRGQSLDIKDLFIRMEFDANGRVFDNLYGTRSTYTIEEFECNYTHSHLPRKQLKKFQSSTGGRMDYRLGYEEFCLGTGEIHDFISIYNCDKTPESFESILYMLNTVASWESIEGTPHIYLANILAKKDGIPNISLSGCHDVFKLLLRNVKKEDDCDIDWVYKNGAYEIVDNEKFEDFLRLSYPGYKYKEIAESYVGFKDETDTFYVPTDVKPEAVKVLPTDFVPFMGNKIILKIEGNIKFSGERKWYINPKIKHYVKTKLECVFNKTQIRQNTIAAAGQG